MELADISLCDIDLNDDEEEFTTPKPSPKKSASVSQPPAEEVKAPVKSERTPKEQEVPAAGPPPVKRACSKPRIAEQPPLHPLSLKPCNLSRPNLKVHWKIFQRPRINSDMATHLLD